MTSSVEGSSTRPVAADPDRAGWEAASGRLGRALADLGRYERRRNPDGSTTDGFTGLRTKCEAKLPQYLGPAR